jgi:hypothetical protein
MRGSGWALERANLSAVGFGPLVAAAERYAGTFTRALKLAGITPARPAWTRSRVISEIQRLHREGVALSSEQLGNSGHKGLVTAGLECGHARSWLLAFLRTSAGAGRVGSRCAIGSASCIATASE